MKKKVLITGISGFIGKHLYNTIKNEGYDIVLSSRDSSVLPKKHSDSLRVMDWDLEKENIMHDEIDILVHLAAEKKNTDKMWQVNFLGTKKLVVAAIKCGVKKIIFLSTVSIYNIKKYKIIHESFNEYSTDSYGISKLAAENFIREICEINNIDFTIIRPTDVIGVENKSFLSLVKSVQKGYFYYFGDYKKTNTNYLSLEDLCQCIIYFIKNKYNNDFIINDSVKLHSIIDTISKTLKVKSPKFSLPKLLGLSASTICDYSQKLTKYKLPFDSNRYNELTNLTIFSSEKLETNTTFNHKHLLLNKIEELTRFYLKNNYLK